MKKRIMSFVLAIAIIVAIAPVLSQSVSAGGGFTSLAAISGSNSLTVYDPLATNITDTYDVYFAGSELNSDKSIVFTFGDVSEGLTLSVKSGAGTVSDMTYTFTNDATFTSTTTYATLELTYTITGEFASTSTYYIRLIPVAKYKVVYGSISGSGKIEIKDSGTGSNGKTSTFTYSGTCIGALGSTNITLIPNDGSRVGSLILMDESGETKATNIPDSGSFTYTLNTPESKVYTVYAVFVADGTVPGYKVTLVNNNLNAGTLKAYNVSGNTAGIEIASGDCADGNNYVIFNITETNNDMRIADFTLNSISYRKSILNGVRGGVATTLREDTTAVVTWEAVPNVLPEITYVKVCSDYSNTNEINEGTVISTDATIYCNTSLDIGYEAMFYWEFADSPDADNWTNITFWQGHTQLPLDSSSSGVDLVGKYIRVRAVGMDKYSKGEAVSRVYQVASSDAGSNIATSYTITATAGKGGSISPTGSVSVAEGDDQTFLISANSGYEILDVLVDGQSVGTMSSYIFLNVTINHTISATFRQTDSTAVTHTITATAGTGGRISPSGSVSVTEGEYQTFSITANSGYSISNVRVDGVSIGARSSYTFYDVDGDHTISATFTSDSSSSSGSGSSIATIYGSSSSSGSSSSTIYSGSSTGSSVVQLSDTGSHWASYYIENVAAKGWIVGYPDGTFRPNGSITRAELVMIVYRLIGGASSTGTSESGYNDVDPKGWYAAAVGYCSDRGYLDDVFEGDSFLPKQAITRGEVSAILAKIKGYNSASSNQSNFSDVNPDDKFASSIEYLTGQDLISGYPDGTFRQENSITRAEICTMLFKGWIA